MPTYEYSCQACGHALEVFQSFSEAPKRKCPACGALKLKRLIGTGGGIIFKGSGFYETDYRSDSYKQAAAADAKAADGGKGAGDSKGSEPVQEKPAAKPAEKGAKVKGSAEAKAAKPRKGGAGDA